MDKKTLPLSCFVIIPYLKPSRIPLSDISLFSSSLAREQEFLGLVNALDCVPLATFTTRLEKITSSTFFGSGKVQEFLDSIKNNTPELIIIDGALSSVQHRNLEKHFKVKILDRVGLILEIFSRRASTREGILQVELAQMHYQKSRLIRSWTHLERQKGGRGFLGGPGETQIESDKRALEDKILKVKKQLEAVTRTRTLHRKKRKKSYPTISLVGYTNSGKSTLFNCLSGADVPVKNMLFSTLDPTLRRLRLPYGTVAMLSDTVGFISDLPTHLISAFKATLEEVIQSDLIIHVRDVSDPNPLERADAVHKVLSQLGIDPFDSSRVLEIWNKIDCLCHGAVLPSAYHHENTEKILGISALTGEGINNLMKEIEQKLGGDIVSFQMTLKPQQFHLIPWIYEHATVIECKDKRRGLCFTIKATDAIRRESEIKILQG